jgi:hypothetical protein
MTDIPGFSHPLLLMNFPAIAKAIRKIAKYNLHNETGAPAERAEKLFLPDYVWTVLVANSHNSSRSFP